VFRWARAAWLLKLIGQDAAALEAEATPGRYSEAACRAHLLRLPLQLASFTGVAMTRLNEDRAEQTTLQEANLAPSAALTLTSTN
jgi:hypothetical protein